MGWKGNLKTGIAIFRSIEKSERRRAKSIAQHYKQLQKQTEFENAQQSVLEYENYLKFITSLHKETSQNINWLELINQEKPIEPMLENNQEKYAELALINFKPTFFGKLFGGNKRRLDKLESLLTEAKQLDIRKFEEEQQKYLDDFNEWNQNQIFAKGILAGNTETYRDVIDYLNPFSDIQEIGSGLKTYINKDYIEVDLTVNGTSVIPDFQLSMLASGKLSKKKIAATKFYELYQDYVCGIVLRIARELFSFLPIKYVFVTAFGEILNTQTGILEQQSILSVAIPIDTIKKINFDLIDPSDSMRNFVHNMKFGKTTGFSLVEKINPLSIIL